MVELEKCPFCDQAIGDRCITDLDDGTWVMVHYCDESNEDELGVVVRVYGNSKEEVIKKWNRRKQ